MSISPGDIFLWSLWTKNSPCLTYQLSVPKELLQSGVGLNSGDQSRYAPNQSEMSLQCNDISHWLGAFLDWSLEQSKPPGDYQAETHWQHWCQNKQHFYDISWHKWIWNWIKLFRKCKPKFGFHTIPHHLNDSGLWHPFSRKTRAYISSVSSIMTKPNNFLISRFVIFYKSLFQMYFLWLSHSDAYHNTVDLHFNPLAPGRCGSNFKSVIPKHLP